MGLARLFIPHEVGVHCQAKECAASSVEVHCRILQMLQRVSAEEASVPEWTNPNTWSLTPKCPSCTHACPRCPNSLPARKRQLMHEFPQGPHQRRIQATSVAATRQKKHVLRHDRFRMIQRHIVKGWLMLNAVLEQRCAHQIHMVIVKIWNCRAWR